MLRLLVLSLAIAFLVTAAPAPARADGSGGDGAAGKDVDYAVARALLERGKELYAAADHRNAKMLFIESLERSADGPWSKDALAMLRAVNERLGFKNLDAGDPSGVPLATGEDPLDPYKDSSSGKEGSSGDGSGKGPDAPLDPYNPDAGEPKLQDPLDPYGDRGSAGNAGAMGGSASDRGAEDAQDDGAIARRRVALWGGGYGALLGLALAGPNDDTGSTRGVSVLLAALGAGAGAAGGWYGLKRRRFLAGQGQAVISAGTWGVYTVALLGDAMTGVGSTTTNEGFKAAALGGAIGASGGVAYALGAEPSEDDVAMVNSVGLYGTLSGLMLGVLMDPPESEAYSINGALGALAGLGVGHYISGKYDVSRRRMLRIDLGAMAGLAASWALFYPLVADSSSTGDEQATGAVSIGMMAVGGYLGWRWTRDMDDAKDGPLVGKKSMAARADRAPLPGLVTRSFDGSWGLGAPVPRPMENPALAPATGGFSMGIDLAAGAF